VSEDTIAAREALRAVMEQSSDSYIASSQNPAWTPELVQHLSLGLAIFGIILIIVLACLLHRKVDGEMIMRVFSIPLIILAGVFLILVGYTENQLAPMFGILGTIAGYLFGRETSKAGSGANDKKKDESGA